jgi:hypothetical protein
VTCGANTNIVHCFIDFFHRLFYYNGMLGKQSTQRLTCLRFDNPLCDVYTECFVYTHIIFILVPSMFCYSCPINGY